MIVINNKIKDESKYINKEIMIDEEFQNIESLLIELKLDGEADFKINFLDIKNFKNNKKKMKGRTKLKK